MRNSLSDIDECLVYPGEYTPLPEARELMEGAKSSGKDTAQPPVNIDEFGDYYKVAMIIPGVRREDILVYANDNILSVAVLQKECKETGKKLKMHEFDTRRNERHILLPEDADTEFVSAEYKQGLLSLYIPKTGEPSTSVTQQIIVY
jgi:HSP20 family protein